uniref:Resistance to inhibitors of cholinesterase 3 variant 3 n=1 Tax=Locusta migratoria manilensis TaxID=229990 RepID=A0A1Y0F4C2_LOCMI|nr:resistance to inhibitors of cholinesterase 3 variant 3 [Locusta migratoria manilensis]
MPVEFGTAKTVFILAIVVGCFAVLWPKLFYPMLQSSISNRAPLDHSQGPIRQERPPHLRPDMLHPALRERGRAIPQSHIVPRIVEKEGRPGPIPGMRPPMGGAGHVVPAPKTGGTMGIIMPMYTIGIVIFFMYTIMKVMFKKPSDHSSSYGEFHPDPEFRKIVFAEDYTTKNGNCEDKLRPRIKNEPASTWKAPEENGTRLGWKERDTRDLEIDHLRKRLEETEAAMERIVAQMGSVPLPLHSSSGMCLGSFHAKTVEDIPEVNNVAASTYLKNEKLDTATSDKSDTSKESFQVNVQEETEHHKTEEKVDTYQPTPAVEAVTSELQEESAGTKPKQKVEFSADTDNQSQHLQQQGQVVVVGMDVTASCEGGGRWSRPVTPVPPQDFGVLPTTVSRSRSATPGPIETETRSIMLEGHLPSHSQLLVSDSETHAEPTGAPGSAGADPPVVLSGKVTLSLISLQEALAAEEEQEQQKHSEQQQDQ